MRCACWILVALWLTPFTLSAADSFAQKWEEVDSAVEKKLPKTAIEKLQAIINDAIREKKPIVAVKAIGKKLALEEKLVDGTSDDAWATPDRERPAAAKIARMQIEIDKAGDDIRPMLQLIQANWYFKYFVENRFRIMRDTVKRPVAPGDAMSTWDVPRLLEEIDRQFQKAFASAENFKTIPVTDFDELLEKGTSPDRDRPTLYDFLVYNALGFYTLNHKQMQIQNDPFVVTVDSPVFSDVNDFLAWKIDTPKEHSLVVTAIQLYQDLLRFHQRDADRSAFLEADLMRLQFGNATAIDDRGSSRYKAALERFAEKCPEYEIWARALAHLATIVSDDKVQSREIAIRGMERFPDSIGGRECRGIKLSIEADDASVSTERVWNKSRPTIDIRYRNMRKMFFRIVPFDVKTLVNGEEWNLERGNLYLTTKEKLLKEQPELAWSVDLPETKDFQDRIEKTPAPDGVAPGQHVLIASFKESFTEEDNQLTYTHFWVSDLALVIRTQPGNFWIDRPSDPVVEGFVLNAGTGEPIADAKVLGWSREGSDSITPLESVTTDKNGLFRFDLSNVIKGAPHHVLVHATVGGDSLSNLEIPFVRRDKNATKTTEQTAFFTDRAIYRPGQTIHFKAICFATNLVTGDSHPLVNRKIRVQLEGGRPGVAGEVELTTNEFGSASGSFTVPGNEQFGNMMISVKEGRGPRGNFSFRVEEYKRPKFRVAIDPPGQAARLNESVKLIGRATTYSGAVIDGAKVEWRVVRQTQHHATKSKRIARSSSDSTVGDEIAQGRATTTADGTFEIDFVAQPNLHVKKGSEPIFQYVVTADVTDTAGETRSGTTKVSVGYATLTAALSADEWQTADAPVNIRVNTTTLDGQAQAATGILRIYALKPPDKVYGEPLEDSKQYGESSPDLSNPDAWELGEVLSERNLELDAKGEITVPVNLPTGIYRIKFTSTDGFGNPATATLLVKVVDPAANKCGLRIPIIVTASKWSVEPGAEFVALWGSGYDAARAYVEIEHRGKLLQNFWTQPGVTQQLIRQNVDESMRGGIMLRVTMVRENRAYIHMQHVEVPWSNKKLTIQWERFVSKLQPAEKVTWTAVIGGIDSSKEAAELVATLYDASLDTFHPLKWPLTDGLFRQEVSYLQMSFENAYLRFGHINYRSRGPSLDLTETYRIFPMDIVELYKWSSLPMSGHKEMRGMISPFFGVKMGARPNFREPKSAKTKDDDGSDDAEEQTADSDPSKAKSPDLSTIVARKNLNETAFFFPHLVTEKDGTVRIEFTTPEALTEWKFLAFAHDRQLRSGYLVDKAVTSKELVVQPNMPRCVREGDLIEFTVKVANQSTERQTGRVRLQFFDANESPVDARLGNLSADRAFDIPVGQSRAFSWKLTIPDGIGVLKYKAIGAGEKFSDGEEGYLPVLSRRVLVTESLLMPLRHAGTKEFDFARLREAAKSDSLQHQSLTIQMTSNPTWYAILALPYLMEFPYECSEQTFNRMYANALAIRIARSEPKLRTLFDTWKGSVGDTLESPLFKNRDLKSVMLEETPWVRDAAGESQARRNIGLLFDQDRCVREANENFRKLLDLRLADGRWPWFKGGPANDTITLYIIAGIGRMRVIGSKLDPAIVKLSCETMDAIATEWSQRIEPGRRDEDNLSATIAYYLFARSFFVKELPVKDQNRKAVDYWLAQAKQHWANLIGRQSQGQLALALKRFGDLETAKAIVASLKERSVTDEESGMHWPEGERWWNWHNAPVETHVTMIEALDEVAEDRKSVEDCRVWLIKHKQTHNWKTTKATSDAIYALLHMLHGDSELLASDDRVEVTVGTRQIQPDKMESGTGFYEVTLPGGSIEPEFDRITTKKVDEGVAWGAVHWQYLEDVSKISRSEGASLKLSKQLFVKRFTNKGPVLERVDGPVAVGDELVIQLTVTNDRDMEYVHLKDNRASGTEPVDVLSGHRFRQGISCYESTRDTATHFFIDDLPKGTHVFDYAVRVQLKGNYQTGHAQLQCLYAPEFNSHSDSVPLAVE